MAEIISKERVPYRIWDKINGVWNELKFKTNAKSVDTADGSNLETKVGAINGISSSATATAKNVAASIGYVNKINNNLGGLVFCQDSEGNWGYKPSGADTVIPFKNKNNIKILDAKANCVFGGECTTSGEYTAPQSGILYVELSSYVGGKEGSVSSLKVNDVDIQPTYTANIIGASQYGVRNIYLVNIKKGDVIKASVTTVRYALNVYHFSSLSVLII